LSTAAANQASKRYLYADDIIFRRKKIINILVHPRYFTNANKQYCYICKTKKEKFTFEAPVSPNF